MHSWRLKKGSEKKFRTGHPWIFSNELAQSPKNHPPGALVDLFEYGGVFLARGYGHPNSLISFRTLTRNQSETIDGEFFFRKFKTASLARKLAGIHEFSHRLCFAEGDGLPGLVIDRYRLKFDIDKNGARQVFVLQSSTAGMDLQLDFVMQGLERLVASESEEKYDPKAGATATWEQTVVVFANDSKSRLMENINVAPKVVKKQVQGFKPESCQIVVQPGLSNLKPVLFEVDFIGGQKTGFFLDQRLNVHLASTIALNLATKRVGDNRPVRVLDLCCYIGQWGTQLAHLVTALGGQADVTLVDASQRALEIAARNVEAQGGRALTQKLDVLSELQRLPKHGFDIVICDPPAFIKKKKDLPTGTAAYLKLNREALKKVAPGGLFVSCSCSGLLGEDDFRSMLAKATVYQENEVRWLMRGSHSPDHPQRPEYPQGTYLKSWLGVVL